MASAAPSTEELGRAFVDHARLLWVIAAAHSSSRDAEDVLQQAALVALQRRQDLTRGDDLRPWLAQIVRFVGRNHRRRGAAGPESLEHEPLAPAPAEVFGPRQLDADALAFDDGLARALDSLPDASRTCLLLRTVLDLSYEEIAQTLQIPAGTVASHVHRARAALRERLQTTPR